MDVRSLSNREELIDVLDALSSLDGTVRILYLEAKYDTILRRYKESRRRHPMEEPGGSVRDEDSIKACNEFGIAMVFTGVRHFKH